MNLSESHQYTSSEVERIIRRALRLKKAELISHDDLLDMAKELGLDSRTVETAIEQEQNDIDLERSRKLKMLRRKAKFHRHLWSYIIVIGALILINIFTPGPWWFQWPMLGWGIGLAFGFRAAYFPAGVELESELWNGDK
jgi:post-segregation antitoxin (ccd killing protein)